ncbi:hypothetical protein GLAREA_03452 [Glarea lozoyensis ATCC 20868]|uniref:Uncharacterized protein n=1 Tax=Glarea lozoyensis (strain ATCC 20868 / MF5171) TaxID=1116229 RepID=S3CXZ8_GLAL2|nr:uncharacterized protein GLAREA_03452 [Glarea lozoyensis ATCC 20868]EPE30485.1 hypothetical protein GLAREA_03452 [Glarea lozoyensis ATCC 20868]
MPLPPHIQAIPPFGQSASTTKRNEEALKQSRIDNYERMTRVEHHHHPKLIRRETFEEFEKRREREEASCRRGQALWDGRSSKEIEHEYKVERNARLKEFRKHKEEILKNMKSCSQIVSKLGAKGNSQGPSGGS